MPDEPNNSSDPVIEQKRDNKERLKLEVKNQILELVSSVLSLLLLIVTPLFIITLGLGLDFLFSQPPGLVIHPRPGISFNGDGYPITDFIQAIGVTTILTNLLVNLQIGQTALPGEQGEEQHPSQGSSEED